MAYKKLLVVLVVLVVIYAGFQLFTQMSETPEIKETEELPHPPKSEMAEPVGYSTWMPLVESSAKKEILTPEDIDEYVLESLLDEGKYCKIVKKEDNEFFLLCNERPFYVKYDEKLDVGNNGWSFLEKNQELWNDLSDCDFYKSVKVKEDEYNLVFYYPKDIFFEPKEMIAKVYSFDANSFEMTKTGESDFFDILAEDLKERYDLEDCELKNVDFIDKMINPFTLEIVFDCGDDYEILFDLSSLVVLQPPILIDSTKTDLERIEASFENIFEECELKSTNQNEKIELNVICEGFDILLTYSSFNNYYLMRYGIEIGDTSSNEIKRAIKVFGKYSMFPVFEFDYLSKTGNELYRLDDKVFSLVICNGNNLCSVSSVLEKKVIYNNMISSGMR